VDHILFNTNVMFDNYPEAMALGIKENILVQIPAAAWKTMRRLQSEVVSGKLEERSRLVDPKILDIHIFTTEVKTPGNKPYVILENARPNKKFLPTDSLENIFYIHILEDGFTLRLFHDAGHKINLKRGKTV